MQDSLSRLDKAVIILLPFFTTALGAWVGYWLGMRKERWQRKRDYLLHQLQLYGPAHALCSQMLGADSRVNKLFEEDRVKIEKETAARGPRYPTQEEQARSWNRLLSAHDTAERYFSDIILGNAKSLCEDLKKNVHFLDGEDVRASTGILSGLQCGSS